MAKHYLNQILVFTAMLLLLGGCVGYITADANGQPHVGMLSLVPIGVEPPPVYHVETPIR